MAQKVKLLELDIDMDAMLTNLAKLKMDIDALKATQKTLDTSTMENAKAFASNAAEIKTLSEQYRIGEGAVRNLSASQNDQVTTTKLVNSEMTKEVNTIKEAQTQNTYLNKIKKDLNANNKEQKAMIDQINQKLDTNSKFIKANSSEQEKQFGNVGNYKSALGDLTNQLKNGEIGLGGFTKGIGQMGKAFLSNPIGIIIMAIVLAVTALYNIFKSFQPVVDKIEQIFAGLSAVLKVLKDGFIGLITGANKAGGSLNGLTGDMKHAYDEAVRLKRAIQDLEDSMEAQSVASAQNRAEIKRLETEAKNTALSYAERNNLLHAAEVIRQKDYGQRLSDALQEKNIAIDLLKTKAGVTQEEIYLLEKGGDAFKENYIKTKDLSEKKATDVQQYFDKYSKAQINISSMQEEFSAEQERNYNKQAANDEKAQAERERNAEKAKALNEKQKEENIKNATSELNLFIAMNESKAKNLGELLKYEEELKTKKLALLETEYTNGAKSLNEYTAEKLNIEKEYNATVLQLTGENLQKELELWKAQNADLLSSKTEMTQAVHDAEIAVQETLKASRKAIIDQTIQDETDKKIALQNLENEHKTAIDSINKEWEDKRKADATAKFDEEQETFALKLEQMELQGATELEMLTAKLANEKIILDQDLANKKLTEEQYQLALTNLTERGEKERTKIKEIEEENKLALTSQAFGNMVTIFGKQSAIGKAFAVAQATVDTYQAANKALSAYPPPFSYIAAAASVATGLANVHKIISTKEKFAEGGFVSGAGSGTSDSIDAKLSNGESVINAKSTAMFRPLLSAMNVAGGGVAFANGGLVGSTGSSMPQLKLDTLTSEQINELINRKINVVKIINVTDETASVMNASNKVKNYANI